MNRYFLTTFALIAVTISGCAAPPMRAPVPMSQAAPDSPAQPTTPLKTTPTNTSGAVTLRIGMGEPVINLNPVSASTQADYRITLMTYDFLYRIGPIGVAAPFLVESASASEDHKTWTLKLHTGVQFHDGRPLTAQDAAFTLNLFKQHTDSIWNPPLLPFDKAEAGDDSTLILHLNTIMPDVSDMLSNFPILPMHIWKPLDDGSKDGSKKVMEFDNAQMIGSGPFKLIEFQPEKMIRLTAVKDHWSMPSVLDEVVIQFMPDTAAQVQALNKGDIDAIQALQTVETADALSKAEHIQVVKGAFEYPAVQVVAINQTDPKNCPNDGICSGHPALQDVRVRQALMHAVDRTALATAAGFGKPGVQLLPDSLGDWSNTSLEGYAFDVMKANQMLDEAGYKDQDGDGVREMPDGSRSLVFRHLYVAGADFLKRIDSTLTEAWKKIGVKVEGKGLTVPELIAGPGIKLDYDLLSIGWAGSGLDPASFLPLAQGSGFGVSNFAGYANPEYDALVNQQATETDTAKRKALMWTMQEIVYRDAPYVIVNYPGSAMAFRTDRFTSWPTGNNMRIMTLYPGVLTQLKPIAAP